MKHLYISVILLFSCLGYSWAQAPSFSVDELPSMPEPVANNAVVSAMCDDTLCIYSFCGIDETKTPAGIHLKAWRYNTVTEIWTVLPDVPDDTGNGKIAAGASVVNNKIYLIGGYYVEDNFSELSSDDVHVFNPETNEWEEDAAPIPVAIDDHVQAVWNDSLVYIVTGWSDTGNVNDVQIYDPALDQWFEGDSPLNSSDYMVFGGSGAFIGNEIYYHGGVKSSGGFFPTSEIRKGTVDPNNPMEIDWTVIGQSELGNTYRAGAVTIPQANAVFWMGGAELGYNFDGVDYNGTGGVEPFGGIKSHNVYSSELMMENDVTFNGDFELPMDLRGIAELSSNGDNFSSIICGGMSPGQEVSDRVFIISSDNVTEINELVKKDAPVWSVSNGMLLVHTNQIHLNTVISSIEGRVIFEENTTGNETLTDVSVCAVGVYICSVKFENGETETFRFLVR